MKKNHSFSIAIAAIALMALSSSPTFAATGCSYPASLDSFTDKVVGDFLTVANINVISCAIEKLEAGPLRLNDGSVSAPAYSFMADPDTGLWRSAANVLDFSVGGARALQLSVSGTGVNYTNITAVSTGNGPAINAVGSDADIPLAISPKGTGSLQLRSGGVGAFVIARQSSSPVANYFYSFAAQAGTPPLFGVDGTDTNVGLTYRTKGTGAHVFAHVDSVEIEDARIRANGIQFVSTASGVTSANFALRGDAGDNLLLGVPSSSDVIAMQFGGNTRLQFLEENSAGGILIEEASGDFSAAAGNAVKIFAKDNGAGKTTLCAIFNSGGPQCFATQP